MNHLIKNIISLCLCMTVIFGIGTASYAAVPFGTENEIGPSIIVAFDDVITVLLSATICVFIGMVLSISAILVFGGVK